MYRGPLPLRCSWSYEHTPLIGLSEDDTFRTSSTVGFGPDYWNSCVFDATLERRFVSLKAEVQADLTPSGRFSTLSIACLPSSLHSVHEHGKLAHFLVLCWWTLLRLTTFLRISRVLLVSLPLAHA